MLLAFVVYIGLAISLSYIAKLSVNSYYKGDVYNFRLGIGFSILTFALVIGTRYNVGVDYLSYKKLYDQGGYSFYGDYGHSFEYAVDQMYRWASLSRLHFSFIFIIFAFLQIMFFYSFFEKKTLFILPSALFFFIVFEFGSFINIIRHYVAFMIFFSSIKYIHENKLLKYLGLLSIGYLFHKSIVICIPIYWIARVDLYRSKKIGIALYCFCIIAGKFLTTYIVQVALFFISFLGYDWLAENYSGDDKIVLSSGIGFVLSLIINLVILIHYKKIIETYKGTSVKIILNLFYLGLLVSTVTGGLINLQRANLYLFNLRFIVVAFVVSYLIKRVSLKKINIDMLYLFLILSISGALFVKAVITGDNLCSPYSFVWLESSL